LDEIPLICCSGAQKAAPAEQYFLGFKKNSADGTSQPTFSPGSYPITDNRIDFDK
jgi:hypothetical protein